MGFRRRTTEQNEVRYSQDRTGAFYIRLRLDDKAGALAKVSAVLANANVSVNTLLQDQGPGDWSDLVVVTHSIAGSQLEATLPALQQAAGPGHTVVVYPVLAGDGLA